MLANPVVVPAYASPVIWGFALLAMWVEIGTEVPLLRRMGMASGAIRPLVLINLMTWLAFLLAVDWFSGRGVQGSGMVVVIAALESLVVIVETILFRQTIGRGVGGVSRQPLMFGQALKVSLVGNLVSITVSLVMPVAIFWLLQ